MLHFGCKDIEEYKTRGNAWGRAPQPKALQAYPRFQTCPAVLGRYLEAAVTVAKRTTASLRACAMLPRTLEEMRARVFQNPCDISELLLVPRDVVDKFLQSTFEWRECRLRSSDRS